MAELATAYFSLLPSMKGTAAAVTAGLAPVEGAALASGAASGAALGGGMVASFGKFIPVIGGLIAGAGIVQIFQDSVAAASDLNESTNAVKVTFGDLASEVNKLSTTAPERLGLSANQFNGIATQFSSFAGTIAGDGGDTIKVLDDLTTRGADFASVYNIDVNEALRLFQSGLAGETEPLRKFGINLSAASVQAFAYEHGIAAAGATLTEQQKVQARYAFLMEQTVKTQGDFANTSDQLANSQRTLEGQLERVRVQLGDALLPALTSFVQYASTDGIPVATKLVDVFVKGEPAITATAAALLGLTGYIIDNNAPTLAFFAIFADGNVTLQESISALLSLPGYLQFGTLAIVNYLASAVNNFLGLVENIVNPVLDLINNVVVALGGSAGLSNISFARLGQISISGTPDSTAGGRVGGRIQLASGGIVTRATNAVVGEGRYPEAVIPLRPDVLAEIGRAIGGGSGRKVEINATGVDPMVVSEMIAQRLGGRLAIG